MSKFTTPIELLEQPTPSDPAAGSGFIYPKSDKRWYTKDSDGVERQVGEGPVRARKSSNQSITGAAGDVTDMGLALEADATYVIQYFIPIGTSTGTGPTLAFSFTGPASPTLVSLRRVQFTTATVLAASVITSFTAFAAGASIANVIHDLSGIVVTSAGNAGTLQLRAAAAGTSPAIQILAGASAYALRIA